MIYTAASYDWRSPYLILFGEYAVTFIIFGVIPLVMAALTRKPVTKKKFTRRCYVWNILLILLMIQGYKWLYGELPKPYIGIYLFWTWVHSVLGLKILDARGYLEDADPAPDPNQAYRCRACGYQSRAYFDACPKCGKFAKDCVTTANLPLPKNRCCSKCGTRVDRNPA